MHAAIMLLLLLLLLHNALPRSHLRGNAVHEHLVNAQVDAVKPQSVLACWH